jgi:hypothetical protein
LEKARERFCAILDETDAVKEEVRVAQPFRRSNRARVATPPFLAEIARFLPREKEPPFLIAHRIRYIIFDHQKINKAYFPVKKARK